MIGCISYTGFGLVIDIEVSDKNVAAFCYPQNNPTDKQRLFFMTCRSENNAAIIVQELRKKTESEGMTLNYIFGLPSP
jgi:hypothetical protein